MGALTFSPSAGHALRDAECVDIVLHEGDDGPMLRAVFLMGLVVGIPTALLMAVAIPLTLVVTAPSLLFLAWGQRRAAEQLEVRIDHGHRRMQVGRRRRHRGRSTLEWVEQVPFSKVRYAQDLAHGDHLVLEGERTWRLPLWGLSEGQAAYVDRLQRELSTAQLTAGTGERVPSSTSRSGAPVGVAAGAGDKQRWGHGKQ